MKYLKKFETQSAFDAVKDTLEKPYIAYTQDNDMIHCVAETEVNYVYLSFGYDLDVWEDGTRLDYTSEYEYEYEGKPYYKFNYSYIDGESGERIVCPEDELGFVLFSSRKFTKLTFPYSIEVLQGYYNEDEEEYDIFPFTDDYSNIELYGYETEQSNKIVIEHYDTSSLDKNGVEYVDLGLPSGTLWAKYNVGAATETEYGKYFQWGDTVGYEGDDAKAHSTWATAPFNNGSANYDSTYFAANSGTWLTEKAELKNEYDAARVNLGGNWRMPSLAQIDELCKATNSEWTTINGVNGRLFTSKEDSSKSIFVPASGDFDNGRQNLVGTRGYVWSSSLYCSNPNDAWYLGFNSGSAYASGNNSRCNGFSVRGSLGKV